MATTIKDLGQLNRRIAFSVPLWGRDTDGGILRTWIVSSEIWAAIEPLTVGSDEKVIGDRKIPLTAVNFRIRNRQGIQPSYKVKYDGRFYDILSVIEDPAKNYLVLETVQIEPGFDEALVESDGETWVDANGNAWVIETGSDSGQADTTNYKPPTSLVFTDSDGNSFSMQ